MLATVSATLPPARRTVTASLAAACSALALALAALIISHVVSNRLIAPSTVRPMGPKCMTAASFSPLKTMISGMTVTRTAMRRSVGELANLLLMKSIAVLQ